MKPLTKITFLIIMLIMLAGCANKWQLEVDLTPEERAEYETKLEENLDKIKNPPPPHKKDNKPEFAYFVNAARASESLGDVKFAINLYKKASKLYPAFSAPHNNMGKLYEKVGEYDKAIEEYHLLINEWNEPRYLYDITWAYIRAKERKNAEKYFNAWQLEFHKTDEPTQEAIKALRAEEKNSK